MPNIAIMGVSMDVSRMSEKNLNREFEEKSVNPGQSQKICDTVAGVVPL